MAKETRIAFRASEEMKARLAHVAKIVGLSETTLVEACTQGLIDYIEEHGEIRLPLVVVPKSEQTKKNQGTVLPAPVRSSRSTAGLSEPRKRV